MRLVRILKYIVVIALALELLVACQSTKDPGKMVGQLKPMNADEAAIYTSLEGVKNHISASQWDDWLALYSDDAVLTNGKDQVNKKEMRKAVDGINYKISEMEILDQTIEADSASVSVRMIGNGKKHLETYKFKKMDGKWLIVEETNP